MRKKDNRHGSEKAAGDVVSSALRELPDGGGRASS